jgi:uncharacterized membrane protein YedE/YeeE
MAMTAPLFETGALGVRTSLLVALAVGTAFGFFLERAGLGNARKLSAQFRLTDFAVLKVMFSAIVTASLGVFWMSRLGALDLSRVNIPKTFLVPQLVGGAVFGVGLVIAGLCPGTACVSAATGRKDGVAVIVGVLVGITAYGAASSLVDQFAASTSRGTFTLPELFGVSHGLTLLAIVIVALGAFRLAEWWERRRSAADMLRSRDRALHRGLAAAALVLAALAAVSGGASPGATDKSNMVTLTEDIEGEREPIPVQAIAAPRLPANPSPEQAGAPGEVSGSSPWLGAVPRIAEKPSGADSLCAALGNIGQGQC